MLYQERVDFTQSEWSKANSGTGAVVSVNATGGAAPDGTNTLNLISVTTAGAQPNVFQPNGRLTVPAATDYTITGIFKATNNPWIMLQASDFSSTAFVKYFNIANGTVGATAIYGSASVTSASATLLGNGFYLVALTGRFASARTVKWGMALVPGDNNNGSSPVGQSVYAWAFQGGNPGSYIPTTTTAATRAADAITLTLPSGTTKVDLVYDNGSTNTVTASAGTYTIPVNPAGTNLKTLRAY